MPGTGFRNPKPCNLRRPGVTGVGARNHGSGHARINRAADLPTFLNREDETQLEDEVRRPATSKSLKETQQPQQQRQVGRNRAAFIGCAEGSGHCFLPNISSESTCVYMRNRKATDPACEGAEEAKKSLRSRPASCQNRTMGDKVDECEEAEPLLQMCP